MMKRQVILKPKEIKEIFEQYFGEQCRKKPKLKVFDLIELERSMEMALGYQKNYPDNRSISIVNCFSYEISHRLPKHKVTLQICFEFDVIHVVKSEQCVSFRNGLPITGCKTSFHLYNISLAPSGELPVQIFADDVLEPNTIEFFMDKEYKSYLNGEDYSNEVHEYIMYNLPEYTHNFENLIDSDALNTFINGIQKNISVKTES